MFNLIDDKIKKRMSYLEKIDEIDREDGTPRMERLRQIPPETGKFIPFVAFQPRTFAETLDKIGGRRGIT